MASLAQFRVWHPTLESLANDLVNKALLSSNEWALDQVSQGSVQVPSSVDRASCAYAVSLIADGLAFNAAQKTGTVKLEDRGEVTVPKDAATALLGMGNHYLSRAKAHIADALTKPADQTRPEPQGLGWSF